MICQSNRKLLSAYYCIPVLKIFSVTTFILALIFPCLSYHAGNCGMSETECGKNATCENECCVCNSGYYGNGEMCVKNGT